MKRKRNEKKQFRIHDMPIISDIFYRMGFNDQQIVALMGAHALGRCHTDASGYDGKQKKNEINFSPKNQIQFFSKPKKLTRTLDKCPNVLLK